MSSTDPAGPTPPTGADGPNPLELFFEKYKKWIYGIAVLLVAALGVNYGLEKLERAKKNKQWRDFTAATALAAQFNVPVELNQLPPQYERFKDQIWGGQLEGKQRALIDKLMEDVRAADIAKIDEQIAAGGEQVPWLQWVAANKLYADRDWEGSRNRCNKLKSDHADHFLCQSTAYPLQVRADKEDADEKKKDDEAKKKKKKKPELEPAVAGSPVDNLLAAIAKDEKFEKEHAHFFKAPEPDASETAIFKLEGVDLSKPVEVEIAFYPEAKKHVEAFKKSVTEGFYKGFRIHQIKRAAKDRPDPTAPQTIHLGNPNSKEDDRTKWADTPDPKDEDVLEFEPGRKGISFFPMMVAAEQEKDGKSSARRFFICANDAAAGLDGDFVIFGRVIRGEEHIQDIATGVMADEAEEKAGIGRPAENITVLSTELKKK